MRLLSAFSLLSEILSCVRTGGQHTRMKKKKKHTHLNFHRASADKHNPRERVNLELSRNVDGEWVCLDHARLSPTGTHSRPPSVQISCKEEESPHTFYSSIQVNARAACFSFWQDVTIDGFVLVFLFKVIKFLLTVSPLIKLLGHE